MMSGAEMEHRIIQSVEMTPAAKERLVQMADSFGMTQITLHSRVIEWFVDQSPLIQHAILGHYPADVHAELTVTLHNKFTAENGVRLRSRGQLELGITDADGDGRRP